MATKKSTVQKPFNLKNPVHFLATGFGSGLLKPAPGTWGSLAGTLIAVIICSFFTKSFIILSFLFLVTFAIGIPICSLAGKAVNKCDDGRIVIDEIAAIFFVFAFIPDKSMFFYGIGFTVFRFFDILKPYPIKVFDKKLKNGFGVMFDDLLAGFYTIILLYLFYFIVYLGV